MRFFTKLLFLIVLLCTSVSASFGQAFIPPVCSQGIGSNAYTMNSILSSANASSRLAAIYTSANLSTVVGSSLSNLYLNRIAATGSIAANSTLKIYLKTTTAADFTAASPTWATEIAGATLVYNGNPSTIVGTTAGWKNFPLIAPFVYGSDNLAVYIEYVQTTACATAAVTWNYEYGATPNACINTGNSNTTKYINNSTATPGATLTATNYRRPVIGFDYTFAPCSGAPLAGTTASTVTTACPSQNFTLSVSAGAVGSGLTYDWQSSPDNMAYTSTGTTTANFTTTQTAATWYRRITTCTASSASATSTPVSVAQNIFTNCYCAIAATSTGDDDIARVTFGTLTNPATSPSPLTSNAAANGTYTNFTALAPASFTQGIPYTMSVQAFFSSGSYANWVTAYIDYNQNGAFETNEVAFSQANPATTSTFFTTSGSVTIPTTSLPGNTRMRVILVELASATAAPCTSFSYGEVEDYTINIVAAPSCSATPTAGTATASTNTACSGGGSNLSLTGATGGVLGLTYQWQSSVAGAGFTDISGATSSTYAATGITAPTAYQCNMTCSGGTIATSVPTAVAVADCNHAVAYNPTATYASIAGSGTSATWLNTSGDDNVTLDIPIGFPFFYKGQTSTVCRASTNGWLSLSSTTSTSLANDLSSTASTLPPRAIAPLWDDLVVTGNNAAGLTSSFKYSTTGSTPNRVFTAEWIGMEQYQHAGPNLNFQVVLREGTNAIEMNYGTMEGFNGTVDKGYSYSIGISSGNTGDYYSLQAERSNNFAVTASNALSLVPDCNTSYSFTPAATNSSGSAPAAIVPANDDATSAIVVPVNAAPCTAFCGTYYSTRGATASSQAVCAGTADDDVWFSFTATSDGARIAVLGSYGFNPRVQLLDASFVSLGCVVNTAAPTTGGTAVLTNSLLTAGNTYYVRVYHDGTGFGTAAAPLNNGSFSLCVSEIVPPPVNDDCAGAINLVAGTTCVPTTGKTISATASTVTPTTTCNTPDDDIWYKFTPTISSPTISVQSGAGFNAAIQAFSGTCASLTSLSCVNSTSTAGLETYVGSALTPGTTYYVRVFHAVTGAGTGNFTVCNVEAAPICPVLSTPATAATNVALSTNLTWAAAVGAAGYNVYLGTNQADVTSNNASTLVGTTTTALTFPTATLLSAGRVYYWTVVATNGIGTSTGCTVFSFSTVAPPPAYNDIAGALDITGLTCSGPIYTNVGTNLETGEVLPSIANGGCWTSATSTVATVWFKFTAPASGLVKISTDQTPVGTLTGFNDTEMALYSSTAPAAPTMTNITRIGCNADGGTTDANNAVLNAAVTPGAVYFVQVAGYGTSTGTFCIDATDAAMSATSVGSVTATCTGSSATATGTTSEWITLVNDGSGQIIMAINTNGQNLGNVTANYYVSTAPRSNSNSAGVVTNYMNRNWSIVSTIAPVNPVSLRLYMTDAELAALNTANASTTPLGNVTFSHVPGVGCSAAFTGAGKTGPITLITQTSSDDMGSSPLAYIELSTPSFSSFYAHASSSPLPITLKSFTATEKGAANVINWETAVENNVRNFAIEKSNDGKTWTKLGEETPSATKRYSMIDNTPFATTYYRLRNIDNDGREDVSNIVVVNRKTGKFTITSVSPNPTNNDLNLKFETTDNANVTINVQDIFGRVVLTQQVDANKGFNTVTVTTSEIPAGAYFLNVNDGTSILTQRIVKN